MIKVFALILTHQSNHAADTQTMSIPSVLSPLVFSSIAVPSIGTAGGTVTQKSTASSNDAFTGMGPALSGSRVASVLTAPQRAPMQARGGKASGVPALSADDALDLQQSANTLSASVEGISGIRAATHKTTMGILRNMGSSPA